MENTLAQDEYTALGERLMVSEIGTDSYIVAADRRPHRAVAGVVPHHAAVQGPDALRDDVGRAHRRHREPAGAEGAALDQRRAPARRRRAGRPAPTEHRDTWWNDWSRWLAERAGELRGAADDRERPAPADRRGAGRVREELDAATSGGVVGLDVAPVDREERLLLVVGEAVVGPDGALGVAEHRRPRRRPRHRRG